MEIFDGDGKRKKGLELTSINFFWPRRIEGLKVLISREIVEDIPLFNGQAGGVFLDRFLQIASGYFL